MRRQIAFCLTIAVAGCGGGNSSPDGSHPLDMASAADLTLPPDLSRPTSIFQYVTNKITLPKNKTDYAADLNGDGKPDNALGFIAQTLLQASGIDLGMQEDASVMMGNGLVLISFATGDPNLVSDTMAAATIYEAKSTANPDFGGKGSFTVDATVKKGTVVGPLTSGMFQSVDPLLSTDPPTVYLKIPLYTDAFVTLPVVGARLQFTPSPTGLAAGQLNGAIKQSDIDNILIPGLATAFTEIAMTMPCNTNANCMTIESMFDKGNCPDDKTAMAGDHIIAPCEVANNGLVQALLAADVQLYDGMGNWKPNPANSNKDSLSLGVAFTGVGAKFVE